jgi:hypothetical protein
MPAEGHCDRFVKTIRSVVGATSFGKGACRSSAARIAYDASQRTVRNFVSTRAFDPQAVKKEMATGAHWDYC